MQESIIIVISLQAVLCTALVWYCTTLSKRIKEQTKKRQEHERYMAQSLALVATQDPVMMQTCKMIVSKLT